MNKLFINNWDFIVFEDDNKKRTISVVFHNSFVDVSKKFSLMDDESEYNFDEFKVLAENIRNNYELYKDREIE